MPIFDSTPVKVPRWMVLLFPMLKGIEDNPLYIRLSGQGYCRRRRWERRPKLDEFSRAGGGWEILGTLIVLTIVISPFLSVPLVLILNETEPVRRFLENGSRRPWGEELYLTRLQPPDYDRALFGAVLQNASRSLLALALLLLAGYLGVAALIWSSGAASPQSPWAPWIAGGLGAAPAIYLEGVMVTALCLSLSFEGSLETAHSGALGGVITALAQLVAILLCHIPGFFLLLVWLHFGVANVGIFRNAPLFAVLFSLYVLVAPSLITLWLAARWFLRNSNGNLGRALTLRVRRNKGK